MRFFDTCSTIISRLEISSIQLNDGYALAAADSPIGTVQATWDLPEGVTASVDRNSIIKLAGIDKELLGQTAAAIRQLRPPEPYKGKGVKYAEEHIRKKAGKAGTK